MPDSAPPEADPSGGRLWFFMAPCPLCRRGHLIGSPCPPKLTRLAISRHRRINRDMDRADRRATRRAGLTTRGRLGGWVEIGFTTDDLDLEEAIAE